MAEAYKQRGILLKMTTKRTVRVQIRKRSAPHDQERNIKEFDTHKIH